MAEETSLLSNHDLSKIAFVSCIAKPIGAVLTILFIWFLYKTGQLKCCQRVSKLCSSYTKSWFAKTKKKEKLEDQLQAVVVDMESVKNGMKDLEKKITENKEKKEKLEDQLHAVVVDMESVKNGMKDMEKKITENKEKIAQNAIDVASNAQFKNSFLNDFIMEMRNIAGRLANANGAPEAEQVWNRRMEWNRTFCFS